MKLWLRTWKPAVIGLILMTALCGILYTGFITTMAQVLFPHQANGSLIEVTLKSGRTVVYGSKLIGQQFMSDRYLIGRPMGATNLSPVSQDEADLVRERARWLRSIDPENLADIPSDLVMASGSGVDPYISPAAAEYQVARLARVRGIGEVEIRQIINRYTTGSLLGIWGDKGVHVLMVNLALDGLLG